MPDLCNLLIMTKHTNISHATQAAVVQKTGMSVCQKGMQIAHLTSAAETNAMSRKVWYSVARRHHVSILLRFCEVLDFLL